MEDLNSQDIVCPIKTECHYCFKGFLIPVFYISKIGKTYSFDNIALKISSLKPLPFWKRLFNPFF
jgi:hypothetical protein